MMKRLVAHLDNVNKEENKEETDSGPDKDNSIGVNWCAFDRNAIIEFYSACTLLLQTASQYSEHEWLRIFLFLLAFYDLVKAGLVSLFLGYYVLKYGLHISFILIGWMVIGIALDFYGLDATNTYVFEECCSNNVSTMIYKIIATIGFIIYLRTYFIPSIFLASFTIPIRDDNFQKRGNSGSSILCYGRVLPFATG